MNVLMKTAEGNAYTEVPAKFVTEFEARGWIHVTEETADEEAAGKARKGKKA